MPERTERIKAEITARTSQIKRALSSVGNEFSRLGTRISGAGDEATEFGTETVAASQAAAMLADEVGDIRSQTATATPLINTLGESVDDTGEEFTELAGEIQPAVASIAEAGTVSASTTPALHALDAAMDDVDGETLVLDADVDDLTSEAETARMFIEGMGGDIDAFERSLESLTDDEYVHQLSTEDARRSLTELDDRLINSNRLLRSFNDMVERAGDADEIGVTTRNTIETRLPGDPLEELRTLASSGDILDERQSVSQPINFSNFIGSGDAIDSATEDRQQQLAELQQLFGSMQDLYALSENVEGAPDRRLGPDDFVMEGTDEHVDRALGDINARLREIFDDDADFDQLTADDIVEDDIEDDIEATAAEIQSIIYHLDRRSSGNTEAFREIDERLTAIQNDDVEPENVEGISADDIVDESEVRETESRLGYIQRALNSLVYPDLEGDAGPRQQIREAFAPVENYEFQLDKAGGVEELVDELNEARSQLNKFTNSLEKAGDSHEEFLDIADNATGLNNFRQQVHNSKTELRGLGSKLTDMDQGTQRIIYSAAEGADSIEDFYEAVDTGDTDIGKTISRLGRLNVQMGDKLEDATKKAERGLTSVTDEVLDFSESGLEAQARAFGLIGALDELGATSTRVNVGPLTTSMGAAIALLPIIIGLIGSLVSVLGGLAIAAGAAGAALGGIFFGGLLSRGQEVADSAESVESAMQGIATVFKAVGKALQEAMAPLRTEVFEDLSMDVLYGLVELVADFATFADAMSDRLTDVIDKLGSKFWDAVPIFFLELERFVESGLLDSVVAAIGYLGRALLDFMIYSREAASTLSDEFGSTAKTVIDFAVAMTDIGLVASKVILPALSAVLGAVTFLADIFTALPESLQAALIAFTLMAPAIIAVSTAIAALKASLSGGALASALALSPAASPVIILSAIAGALAFIEHQTGLVSDAMDILGDVLGAIPMPIYAAATAAGVAALAFNYLSLGMLKTAATAVTSALPSLSAVTSALSTMGSAVWFALGPIGILIALLAALLVGGIAAAGGLEEAWNGFVDILTMVQKKLIDLIGLLNVIPGIDINTDALKQSIEGHKEQMKVDDEAFINEEQIMANLGIGGQDGGDGQGQGEGPNGENLPPGLDKYIQNNGDVNIDVQAATEGEENRINRLVEDALDRSNRHSNRRGSASQ